MQSEFTFFPGRIDGFFLPFPECTVRSNARLSFLPEIFCDQLLLLALEQQGSGRRKNATPAVFPSQR